MLSNEIIRAEQRHLALSDESILRRYQRRCKKHNVEMMLLMEGLKRLFGSDNLCHRWMRNRGMHHLNQNSIVKNWLAKQALSS